VPFAALDHTPNGRRPQTSRQWPEALHSAMS
jgi:hypothetical protein